MRQHNQRCSQTPCFSRSCRRNQCSLKLHQSRPAFLRRPMLPVFGRQVLPPRCSSLFSVLRLLPQLCHRSGPCQRCLLSAAQPAPVQLPPVSACYRCRRSMRPRSVVWVGVDWAAAVASPAVWVRVWAVRARCDHSGRCRPVVSVVRVARPAQCRRCRRFVRSQCRLSVRHSSRLHKRCTSRPWVFSWAQWRRAHHPRRRDRHQPKAAPVKILKFDESRVCFLSFPSVASLAGYKMCSFPVFVFHSASSSSTSRVQCSLGDLDQLIVIEIGFAELLSVSATQTHCSQSLSQLSRRCDKSTKRGCARHTQAEEGIDVMASSL